MIEMSYVNNVSLMKHFDGQPEFPTDFQYL